MTAVEPETFEHDLFIVHIGDLQGCQVSGIRGHHANHAVGENAPKPVLDKIRSGDLLAHIEHVVAGALTV